METKKYLKLCAAIALMTVMGVLLIPGLSESIETGMLIWLGSNAGELMST